MTYWVRANNNRLVQISPPMYRDVCIGNVQLLNLRDPSEYNSIKYLYYTIAD